jgi:putative ABC transport system permease protein
VVGVAGNVRSEGQYAPFIPEIYVPYTQQPWVLWPRNILVRTAGDPLAIVGAIRGEVAALDKDAPISEVTTMQEVVAGPMQQGQEVMGLLESLAGLALLLSAVGIYSVISYSVTQRTHEIGIRMALGSSHGDVAGLVVRHGVVLASIGLAAGWLGTLALGRFFSSLPFEVRWMLLFDVRPADPLVVGTVSAILALVALLGCYIPARRASRVDPMVALRYE